MLIMRLLYNMRFFNISRDRIRVLGIFVIGGLLHLVSLKYSHISYPNYLNIFPINSSNNYPYSFFSSLNLI
jgi:hypothetical protein